MASLAKMFTKFFRCKKNSSGGLKRERSTRKNLRSIKKTKDFDEDNHKY